MKYSDSLKIVTPSWVVNIVGVSVGILVTAGIIVQSYYRSSNLSYQVSDVQQRAVIDQQGGLYANITLDSGQAGSLLDNIPLLLTWAGVGLLVYFLAITVAKLFGEVVTMREELDYVHASRGSLIREAILHMIVRIVAIVGWVLFIQLSIEILVPYAIAAASAAAIGLSFAAVGYVLVAMAMLYLDVLGHAIFLRLIFLRVRLFDR